MVIQTSSDLKEMVRGIQGVPLDLILIVASVRIEKF